MELIVIAAALLIYWLIRSLVLTCVRARRIRQAADATCVELSKTATPLIQRATETLG